MNISRHHRPGAGRVRLELIAAGFALTVIGAGMLIGLTFKEEKFHTTGSAAGIRLVGVRPDASDDLYDVEGKKIGTRFYDGPHLLTWGSNMLRRDFIFELPEEARIEPVYFHAEIEKGWMAYSENFSDAVKPGRRAHQVAVTLPSTFWRSSMFFNSPRPTEFVNGTLGFYPAERGVPALRFAGPFVAGVTNRSAARTQSWLTAVLILTNDMQAGSNNAKFHVVVNMPNPNRTALTFRDVTGKARLARFTSTSSSGTSATWDGSVPLVAVSNLLAVELHLPQEKVFHQVAVRYPERAERTYPAVNDQLARRMATNFQPGVVGFNFAFTNAAQVLAVIESVRSAPLVEQAWKSISPAKSELKLAALSESDRARVLNAARAWSGADEPGVRCAGVNLGLRAGGGEFVAPALQLVAAVEASRVTDLLLSLAPYAAQFSDPQIELIARRALQSEEQWVLSLAVDCLANSRTAAATNAVKEINGRLSK